MVVSEISSFIPNPFGGFAPFPNSIMIPFMATQSAVLGYNFGIGYEMGKRTIKSLDNDFFNKIRAGSTDTISVVTDGQEIKMQYNEYISFITKRHGHEQIQIFESMIPNFMKLQDTIIEKSVDIEMKKAERTPSAFVEILQTFGQASAKLLVEKVDLLAETEKTFILTTQPMIATIYFLHKLLGGITTNPFIPDPTEPPEPEPPLKEPEPEPVDSFEAPPKEPEPVDPNKSDYTLSWINTSTQDHNWNWLSKTPITTFKDNWGPGTLVSAKTYYTQWLTKAQQDLPKSTIQLYIWKVYSFRQTFFKKYEVYP